MAVISKDRLKALVKSEKLRVFYASFSFSIRKGKIKQIWHFISRGHIFRKWRISIYLQGKDLRILQIGGGYHTKYGWLNGDLIAGDIYLNAAKKFPLPDESFDLIFAEQFIEHLSFQKGFYCLKECYRVLKKSGKIRLSTPDLEGLCSLYKDQNPDVDLKTAMERHKKGHNKKLTTACHLLNDFFRLWGHSFIYDEKTLRMQMEKAGFSNISRHKFGCSNEKALAALERHADVEWMKNAFVVVLEAEKTRSRGTCNILTDTD